MSDTANLSKPIVQNPFGHFGLDFEKAAERLRKIVTHTPLQYNQHLSRKYNCQVYLKREDLQIVRSYKLRGAYNMMSTLAPGLLERGVVCASAGNHAQGFAYSCKKLQVHGLILVTPNLEMRGFEENSLISRTAIAFECESHCE